MPKFRILCTPIKFNAFSVAVKLACFSHAAKLTCFSHLQPKALWVKMRFLLLFWICYAYVKADEEGSSTTTESTQIELQNRGMEQSKFITV